MLNKKTKQTIREAKKGARDIKNEARQAAEYGRDELESFAEHAGARIRDVFDSASDEFNEVTDTVTTRIKSNPIQSTMIALGAGVLIGALLRR